jgi:hypothetical protein
MDGGSARCTTATWQHKHRINADIHAVSGIRTNDPRVQVSEKG